MTSRTTRTSPRGSEFFLCALAFSLLQAVGVPSLATDDSDFCSSLTGVNQIRMFFECRQQSDMDACAGLGASASGRWMSEEAKSEYENTLAYQSGPFDPESYGKFAESGFVSRYIDNQAYSLLWITRWSLPWLTPYFFFKDFMGYVGCEGNPNVVAGWSDMDLVDHNGPSGLNACKLRYEIDPVMVPRFLNLTDAQKLKALKLPRVCKFYKTLHDKMFKQIKFAGLECQVPDRFSVELADPPRKYVALLSDKHYIKKIGRYPGSLPQFKLDADEKLTALPAYAGASDDWDDLRLFLPDARDCCLSNSDAVSFKCQQQFGSGTKTDRGGKGPVGERDSGTK